MGQRPGFLEDLPPMTGEVCTVHLLREQGYVTLVMRRPDGDVAGVFTMHSVEAESLGTRTLALGRIRTQGLCQAPRRSRPERTMCESGGVRLRAGPAAKTLGSDP